jgi:hypothetical protein
VFKHFLLVIWLAGCLAACGTAAPETGNATEATGGDWVELGGDLDIDESILERVTPAPVEPVTMSLAEAEAAWPIGYALPAWAPEGFVLQDDVEVIQPASGLGYTSLSFTWLAADEAALRLQVIQTSGDQPALGAAGSAEAVTVNGTPAVLVRISRLGTERLALTWPRGDLTYTLTADPGRASPEDLRRMAESVV